METVTLLQAPTEISGFPYRIEFKTDSTISDFAAWYQENKSHVKDTLLQTGAILFRGLKIETVEGFESTLRAISSEFLPYVDGNSPRTKLTSNVYTSTEYDPAFSITLHNELSYSYAWPSQIFFCCTNPAKTGGETPIADGRAIVKNMYAALVEEIEQKGLRYIRNLNNGEGLGPSWQHTFETTDKKMMEEYCRRDRIEYQWKADGGVRLVQKRKGILIHPLTGDKVWFNQIDQFHPAHLDQEVFEALMMVYDKEEDLPTYVTFGDGSKISAEVVQAIRKTIDRETKCFSWRKGDFLMLDNVLTSHGRKPYTGDRKVLVAMTK